MFNKKALIHLGCIAFLFLLAQASLGADQLFRPAQGYYSGGYYAQAVSVADVNGDGRPDVIVSSRCLNYPDDCMGVIGVLLGNGDGTFRSALTYRSGGYLPWSISVADVNGDGKADVVVANRCLTSENCTEGGALGNVGVLLGNGDGTFRAAVTYSSGGNQADSVSVSDIDRDGKPDVLVANMCPADGTCAQGSVGVLFGNGDGTFRPAITFGSGGNHASAIAVGDLNLDGKSDVVVTNDYSSNLVIFLGNGDGTFQMAQSYDSGGLGPLSVVLGDVNDDGKPDAIIGNLCIDNCIQGGIAILLGNGDGTFQTAVTYGSGGYEPGGVALGDINGDGKLDVLAACECLGYCQKVFGIVGVLLGNGDGTFQGAQTYRSGGKFGLSVAVQDVNGDDRPDVVTANFCLDGTRCSLQNGRLLGGVGVLLSLFGTTTDLSSSPNPSAHGQTVTFTATVSSAGPTPTGKVKFVDGTKGLGTVALTGGIARLKNAALRVGTHAITAHYLGDSASAKSSSPVLDQVVQ